MLIEPERVARRKRRHPSLAGERFVVAKEADERVRREHRERVVQVRVVVGSLLLADLVAGPTKATHDELCT